MTTTTTTTATAAVSAQDADTRRPVLWRTGAVAGVAAAVATTAITALGLAAGVSVDIDGEAIPLLGFAQLTLMCTAIGVLLAKALARWAKRPQRTFVATTVVLTALSIVPDFLVVATPATKLLLIATHLVAAAIVIPAVARALPRTRG